MIPERRIFCALSHVIFRVFVCCKTNNRSLIIHAKIGKITEREEGKKSQMKPKYLQFLRKKCHKNVRTTQITNKTQTLTKKIVKR